MSPLRFTELRLRHWKNFAQVEVKLARRVFIVGANASGKSNLLDAMRFLRDLATEGGGLAKSVELRGGISSILSLYARGTHTEVGISCKVNDDSGNGWSYEIGIDRWSKVDPRPVVAWERVALLNGSGSSEEILMRPDANKLHLRTTASWFRPCRLG